MTFYPCKKKLECGPEHAAQRFFVLLLRSDVHAELPNFVGSSEKPGDDGETV